MHYSHNIESKNATSIIEKGHLAVGDFGIATLLEKDKTTGEYRAQLKGGTPYFKPPEQVKAVESEELMVTRASDIWALGVMVHLLKFKRYPFLNYILKECFPEMDKK